MKVQKMARKKTSVSDRKCCYDHGVVENLMLTIGVTALCGAALLLALSLFVSTMR